jgi:hypothetical protein
VTVVKNNSRKEKNSFFEIKGSFLFVMFDQRLAIGGQRSVKIKTWLNEHGVYVIPVQENWLCMFIEKKLI